jgi:hypothetical protein
MIRKLVSCAVLALGLLSTGVPAFAQAYGDPYAEPEPVPYLIPPDELPYTRPETPVWTPPYQRKPAAPRPQATPRSRWKPKAQRVAGRAGTSRGGAPLSIPAALPLKLHGGPLGIEIRLGKQRIYLKEGNRIVTSFPCSTGLRRGATPQGWFRVVEKIQKPGWIYKDKKVAGGTTANPLGVCWMGLGMPRGWKGAPIGMHGTNSPWVIGRPASHGCVRLLNQHAWTLYRNIPIGTPVHITK